MARRVDPILKEIDAPYENSRDLREARSERATAVRKLLPRGSRVSTPMIERSDAGSAQAKAVSPSDSGVAIDVELHIKIPTTSRFPGAITSKLGGIRFLPERKYIFQSTKRS